MVLVGAQLFGPFSGEQPLPFDLPESVPPPADRVVTCMDCHREVTSAASRRRRLGSRCARDRRRRARAAALAAQAALHVALDTGRPDPVFG